MRVCDSSHGHGSQWIGILSKSVRIDDQDRRVGRYIPVRHEERVCVSRSHKYSGETDRSED